MRKIKVKLKITNLCNFDETLKESNVYFEVIYNIQGQDGDYFICNEWGRVFWLDNLSSNGVVWEYVK